MADGDFKDLTRRTTSDKILREKAINIAKNPNSDGYQCRFAGMVYKFFDKKTSTIRALSEILAPRATENKFVDSGIKNENISNKELAEELHKPIIKKIKNKKVQSPYIHKIWGADLADMQLIRKVNKGIMCYYVLLILSVKTHVLFL